MRVEVETIAGPYGEPEPASFAAEGRALRVREVLDRWPGNACTYFKVDADDDAHYILRHAYESDVWDVHQVNDT